MNIFKIISVAAIFMWVTTSVSMFYIFGHSTYESIVLGGLASIWGINILGAVKTIERKK